MVCSQPLSNKTGMHNAASDSPAHLDGKRFSKREGRRAIVILFAPLLAGYKWIFVPAANGSQERERGFSVNAS